MVKNEKRIKYEQRIFYVQDYICNNINEELNLEKLARISNFSSFHFHRIFKSITGETIYDFIQRIRLEKACSMLLSDQNMKIIHIAMNYGFSTPSSFSKAFKKQYHMTPTQYRRCKILNKSKNGTHNSSCGKEIIPAIGYFSDKELEKLYHWRKNMNVKVEILPEYRIAYMRQIGPYGAGNIQLMQKLKLWAITRDLLNVSSIILGIAHDDPEITSPEKCRYDACLVIPDDYKPENCVNESKLSGGKYAIFPVEHTSEAIANAWEKIFSVWLPESGFQIDDRPVFERYSGVNIDIKIEPVCCEICIPVKQL